MTTVAEALVRACVAQRQSNPTEALREAARAFVARALTDPSCASEIAAAVGAQPIRAQSWMAIVLGSAVESGLDPSHAASALFSAFDAVVTALANGSLARSAHDDALDALPRFAQGVVAHLAKLSALREALAKDGAMIDRLRVVEAEMPAAGWVREAIERVSGALIVLHPTSATGAILRIENVSNCFHLFSLVQCAIGEQIPGGNAPRTVVARCARGEVEAQTDDQAWWHYGDPRTPAPELSASVWGEASVRSVPMIDGTRVLLLWPPLVGARFWDSGFFGPFLDAMPSNVVFERALDDEECRAWMARLGLDSHGRN